MMTPTPSRVLFIANYKRMNSYALNVLVGAVEQAGLEPAVELAPARTAEALDEAITGGLAADKRIVVGWSFYSTDFVEALDELRAFKARYTDPRIINLAGGVHATAETEETCRSGFDLVAAGEGEVTIVQLLKALASGAGYAGITGIAYIDDDGAFVSNGSGERIDLNDYPPFAPAHRRHNPIEITRGCIYSCKFCQTPFMFKARFRHRSVENVARWVVHMKSRGLTDIRFITPTSLSYGTQTEEPDLDAVEDLLGACRAVLGSSGRLFFGSFPSEVRPEHVTPEAMRMLKRYVDNDNLIIGGQSGSEQVLASSNRGHGVQVIVDAVRYALEAGFTPNVDFIFGLPGETSADAAASLRLADELSAMGARIHGHTFMPLPGTPYRRSPAGKITPANLQKLHRLESRGALYGQWERQIGVSETLVQLSTKRPRRGVAANPGPSHD